jgi:kinesin family protein 5
MCPTDSFGGGCTQTCGDEMTLRVAAGAIANLAMSEANQHRIVAEGGLELLVTLARTAQDPQTQRMIAGAIANLCGNANILEQLLTSGSLQVRGRDAEQH